MTVTTPTTETTQVYRVYIWSWILSSLKTLLETGTPMEAFSPNQG